MKLWGAKCWHALEHGISRNVNQPFAHRPFALSDTDGFACTQLGGALCPTFFHQLLVDVRLLASFY